MMNAFSRRSLGDELCDPCWSRLGCAMAILMLFCGAAAHAHESPIDHVDRNVRLTIRDGKLDLRYRVELAERNVMLQLHAMDANADGVVDEDERRAYFAAQAIELSSKLQLKVGDVPLVLEADSEVALDPRLGQTFHFTAPLDELKPGRHRAVLADYHARYTPGPYRLLQPPLTPANVAHVALQDRPQLVDLERHPGLVVIEFEIVKP